MIVKDGIEYRNLVEQVQKNKEDIARHYEIDRVLADWGIKVIGRLDTWEIPTGSFEYGDAYAVGPEGGPFDFYIYTRGTPDYWLNYGSISIVGPQGPQGEPGPQGEQGKSSKWYVGQNEPTGNIQPNDMWLRANNDGTTNGFVYAYQNGAWVLYTSILGPTGPRGPQGATGPQGPSGAQGPAGPRGFTTITNIIGELPEGSIISDTYDPALQPDNATILMPVDGVQHAWVIINGIWTDAGPYSGGSTVYVGGQAVNSFDADTKLDKKTNQTTTQQVYCKTASGGQFMANFTETPTSNAVPKYTTAGVLNTNTPTSALHCANKSYVDNAIAAAHNGGSIKSYIYYGMGGADAGGRIQLGFFENQFRGLTIDGGTVEIPTAVLYYQISAGTTVYYSVTFGNLKFTLKGGTWDNGLYQIEFMDAGAATGVLQAVCSVESTDNSSVLNIEGGNGATGAQYAYAALLVPPNWSSEW